MAFVFRYRHCLFLLIYYTCLLTLISKHTCLAFVLVVVSPVFRPCMIMTTKQQQQHRATIDRDVGDENSCSSTVTTTKTTMTTTRTTTASPTTMKYNNDIDEQQQQQLSAQILLRHAQELRGEALSLEKALNQTKMDKIKREEEKVDHWIQELLFMPVVVAKKDIQMKKKNNNNNNDNNNNNNETSVVALSLDDTELLNTVERTVEHLKEDRFSHEQVNKIFRRICETSPQKKQSRSNHSPVMALLLDAVGRLDDIERQDNPNKRWSGRVEQDLQERLFAMDWNINLEDLEEEEGGGGRKQRKPWKLW